MISADHDCCESENSNPGADDPVIAHIRGLLIHYHRRPATADDLV
jgi:hypothetical protein